MSHVPMLIDGATHQVYAALLGACGRTRSLTEHDGELEGDLDERDRGAVSLEQVLWFVAAGVSVAVIATVLWGRIRDEADAPLDDPDPPRP